MNLCVNPPADQSVRYGRTVSAGSSMWGGWDSNPRPDGS